MKIRVAVVVALTLGMGVHADDWPQWRGPNRDGVSKETGLLKAWPAGGPKLAWTFKELGVGFSGPAVVGKHIYIAGAKQGIEYLFALDTDGKKVWEAKLGPTYDWTNQWSSGPLGTPTVDSDQVFVLTSAGDLVSVTNAGKVQWSKSMTKDLGGKVNPIQGDPKTNGWGYSWSPLVDGEKVICIPGGPQGVMAALNRKTGEVMWRSKGATDEASYSSPMIATVGGVRHYVQVVQSGAVGIGSDGGLLWRYTRDDGDFTDIVAPTPIVHDGHVFLTAWDGGNALLKLTAAGGKVAVAPVYQNKDISNKQGGVVLVGDHVYGFNDARNTWVCVEFKTGEVKWRSGVRNFPVGSVVAADGMLYAVAEARPKGGLGLLAASPEMYKELSRADLPPPSSLRRPSGKMWTHPVIVNGKLYLRDQEMLYCYEVK